VRRAGQRAKSQWAKSERVNKTSGRYEEIRLLHFELATFRFLNSNTQISLSKHRSSALSLGCEMRIAEPEIVGDEPRKQRGAGNELEILYTACTKLEVSQIHILPSSNSRSEDVFRQSVSSILRSHWEMCRLPCSTTNAC
jgi:hypothetical protein